MAAADVTPAVVRSLSLRSEFDSLSDTQIQTRIDLAELQTNRLVWDQAAAGGVDRGDDGVTNLSAHFLKIDMGASDAHAGPVMAEAAGGMSRQYGLAVRGNKVTLDESMLLRTIYGQRYLMLRSSLLRTPLTVNTSGGGQYVA